MDRPDGRQAGGTTTQTGRPRDPRIDPAVLAATVELLEEVGYTKLSIPTVAARAGTSPPAVYRRWPTKVELVYEAAFPNTDETELPWGDDLESSIRMLVTAVVELLSEPAVRAAVSGLIAELAAQPGLSTSLLGRLQSRIYEQFQERLDEEAAAGRAISGLDGNYLVDMVSGAVLMSLNNERELDDGWIDQTVRVIVGGISAR